MRAFLATLLPRGTALHSQEYVQSLDGIRGVSILLVLASHATLPGFAWAGGIGVDIFFVLSGYLITLVLLREQERTGSISLNEFYKRRTLRLFPALLLMCLLFAGYALLFLNDLALRLQETFEALLYVSNWSRAFQLGTSLYLGHTWSLGVEEQFYLLWPILLIVLLRMPCANIVVPCTALVLAGAAAAWRVTLAIQGADVQRFYTGFDTRCDAVLIGCALAFMAPRLAVLWPVGAAGLGVFVVTYHLEYFLPFATTYTIVAVLAALLIAGAANRTSMVAPILSFAPLAAIGRISYGLYIYHFPIGLIIGYKFGHAVMVAIGLPLTFAVAMLSYRYLEQPCLRLRGSRLSAASTRILGTLGPACLIAGSIWIAYRLVGR